MAVDYSVKMIDFDPSYILMIAQHPKALSDLPEATV